MGCTDEEVARVAAAHGNALPGAYRCYLSTMGRDGGGCFEFSYDTYPKVLEFRDHALKLLRANRLDWPDREIFELPDDAVVISFHDQGYGFLFIRASLGDNPPVERWSEGTETDRAEVVAPSVVDWIASSFADLATPEGEANRRRVQRKLQRQFDPPSCPECNADWSAYAEVQIPPHESHRHAVVRVTCGGCRQPFIWLWGIRPQRPSTVTRGDGYESVIILADDDD